MGSSGATRGSKLLQKKNPGGASRGNARRMAGLSVAVGARPKVSGVDNQQRRPSRPPLREQAAGCLCVASSWRWAVASVGWGVGSAWVAGLLPCGTARA